MWVFLAIRLNRKFLNKVQKSVALRCKSLFLLPDSYKIDICLIGDLHHFIKDEVIIL
jgi:hypothetical protein